MHVQPNGQSELAEHGAIGSSWHNRTVLHTQLLPASQMAGIAGQWASAAQEARCGGNGIASQGVATPPASRRVSPPEQSHTVPLEIHWKPSPQSVSARQGASHWGTQALPGLHDSPLSVPFAHSVSMPISQTVPEPQSKLLLQGRDTQLE